ncbi:PVC-type heme-binding CxxCH protein [Pseudocolwellia agarivorans]|uniref:PVC-type heme-binding CxxCH protein n=1 Tax=Pseudocolwellia agarivorans TaxID=1911682 RepID=UPI0009870D7F|nr:PVC-type heme-binding CxxCH protein [Pseudocolwellia agarivorans]
MIKSFYVLPVLCVFGFTACGYSTHIKNNTEADKDQVQVPYLNPQTKNTSQAWKSLLESNDLSQWKIVGGKSTYHIENNAVVGTSVASKKNTFLISKETYSDFIFETDVKADTSINSGIQFRSNIHNKGFVYGYQMEIDTSTRAWSGGIYDQSRRGWIYNLTRNNACSKEFKVNDWNKYRIEAIGNTIKTFINNVPCSSVIDDMTSQGFIALQVHSAGKNKDGKKVQWRDPKIITVKPKQHLLKIPENQEPLVFNYLNNQISEDETKQGWSLIPLGDTAQKLTAKNNLVIDNPHTSFELELDFKLTDNLNAAINYLATSQKNALIYPLIDNDIIKNTDKGINSLGAIKGLVAPKNLSEPTYKSMRFNGKGQWNRARILVQQTQKDNFHIEHWMNNIKIAEYEFKTTPETVNSLSKVISISLQQGQLEARNVKLKGLPEFKSVTEKKNPGDRPGHVMDKVVPENIIPPSPILSIEEALNAFKVHKDFDIDVIAQDPLVFDPVVALYDAAGRLWVVEMTTFMQDVEATDEMLPESQIVVLTDTNQDGIMDKRQVLIENILLPRALAFVPNGIIWADHVKLYFSELSENNGKFTVINTEVVDATYAKGGNVEHKPNGLLYSLDNWYYNAKSKARYRPIPLDQKTPDGTYEIYRNKHWKMLKAETEFRGQWGITQDDYGRHYFLGNSSPLHTTSFIPNVVNRLPQHKFSADLIQQKLGTAEVFPIRVTPGLNRGYNKGMYNEDFKLKYHTAACGPLIYRGDQFPEQYYGIGLMQEPAGNLVKAIKLSEINGIVKGEALFEQQELLASTDERFRPVSAINSPDGTITVIDFYHGILQHRVFLTSYLAEQIKSRDLERNKHIGRLYRLKHKSSEVKKVDYLNNLTATQLVPYLAHSNGWHRDMAQQLIVMKQDKSVINALKTMAISHSDHLARIKALWTLEGLNALDLDLLKKAVQVQQSPELTNVFTQAFINKIKRSVYRLSEHFITSPPLTQWIEGEAKTANAETANALILAAGTHKVFKAITSLTNTFGVTDFTIASIGQNHKSFIAEQNKRLNPKSQKNIQAVFNNIENQVTENKMNKKLLASFNRGKELFEGKAGCFGCHGADGEGSSMVPPLNKSTWVTQSPERLSAILLRGLYGPVTVRGTLYKSPMTMPGLAESSEITDAELADIASYIRNAWQNKSSAVSEDMIKAIRKNTENQHTPFTVDTLKQAGFK